MKNLRMESKLKKKKPLSLASKASILCNDKRFHEYGLFNNSSEAAVYIRRNCGVTSREELDKNLTAAGHFYRLLATFEDWKAGQGHKDNLERA